MCTLSACTYSRTSCFKSPATDDDKTPWGCDYFNFMSAQCTSNKLEDMPSDIRPVLFPKTADIMLRTACCCSSCGFNVDPKTCIGIGQSMDFCCCAGSDQCSLQCDEDPDYGRACQGMICYSKDCSCESGQQWQPCLCSVAALAFCCIQTGSTSKCECCPENIAYCPLIKGHCCCIYNKVTYCPKASEEIPCEIGCCGIFCLKDMAGNEAVEEKFPKLYYGYDADEVTEPVVVTGAVVVEKSGAPATVIDDANLQMTQVRSRRGIYWETKAQIDAGSEKAFGTEKMSRN